MISHGEWRQIQNFVAEQIAALGQNFIQAEVVRRDSTRKVVWVKELGAQPIPLIGFDYTVKYHDERSNGVVQVKTADAEIQTPEIGETILIALHLGSRRLPKCLGVIKSNNYVSED